GVVVWGVSRGLPVVRGVVAIGAYLYALFAATGRRRRPATGEPVGRLDFELASLATVGVVAGVWWAQDGARGPFWGLAYLGFAVVCGFARPLASAGTWLVFAGLVGALHANARGLEPRDCLPPVLLGAGTG